MYEQNIITDKFVVTNSDKVKAIEDTLKEFFTDEVLVTITKNTN